MTLNQEFHPSVELLTSSKGGSIHILRFTDPDFFKAFYNTHIRRVSSKSQSLEFCYLISDQEQTEEEVLIVHLPYPECHIHGGKANVEHFQTLS